MQIVSIYGLTDENEQVRYVGKSIDPINRFKQHLQPAQINRYKSKKNSWLKSLKQDPGLVILSEVPGDQADFEERRIISELLDCGFRLVNGTDGGDGGAVTDPAALERIRQAHLGAKHTAETKKMMSESHKKRCSDPAERQRMSKTSIAAGCIPPVHRGEKNGHTQLTDQQVREIRSKSSQGAVGSELAHEYRITNASVTQLVTGQSRVEAGGIIRKPAPRSRTTKGQWLEIRNLIDGGMSQEEVAMRYGISQSHISKTLKKRQT